MHHFDVLISRGSGQTANAGNAAERYWGRCEDNPEHPGAIGFQDDNGQICSSKGQQKTGSHTKSKLPAPGMIIHFLYIYLVLGNG